MVFLHLFLFFNFKLSKCIFVFGYYTRGVIDCSEWKTETPRMRKYGESKTTRIMMATVPHVTSGSRLRKFQADGFLLDRVYIIM